MYDLDKLQNIQKNVSLASYTTFKIGGKANYFYEAKKNENLIKAIKVAKKAQVPYFILGGGSNVLVSDSGFNGLVIRIQNTKYEIRDTTIRADAGVLLGKLVDESVKAGLTGLEWAVGIPGTVGGAVRGNVGAFGTSVADIVENVKVLKMPELRIMNYESRECKFGYRDSVFKHNKDIILSIKLELKKGNKETSKRAIEEHLAYRKKHQPLLPSAGCIFKNTLDYSAGYLIEECGLKGKKIGKAMIFEKHGNFIVNTGNTKAGDVIELIKLCKEKVKEKLGIELKEEIEYLGEF